MKLWSDSAKCVTPIRKLSYPIQALVLILQMILRLNKASSIYLVILLLALTPSLSARGQSSRGGDWSATAADRYDVLPDVTYSIVNGTELKLDLYTPREHSARTPVVVYFHGGGWVTGDKNDSTLQLLPYLRMGWAAINVNYRLAKVALAPAALEDSRCALRWVADNAGKYDLDLDKVIFSGHSAGGYLALMVGMLPESAGLDRRCRTGHELKPAAIVNWFGITDVHELVSGRHPRSFALQWLGSRADRDDFAKRLSPLSYVRPGLPPIITVHGDADPTVPFAQASRFHHTLGQLGIKNRLVTITGGKHGWFTAKEDQQSYFTIQNFLSDCGLSPVTTK
jgi:acetyl esterase/lipase